MRKVKPLALIAIIMAIDFLPMILNGQYMIITDYPFYTSFDIIHYSVLTTSQNRKFFAVELIDWQGKAWQKQKQYADNLSFSGAINLNNQMPSGFYWIRVYPAAFYQSEDAPAYYPVAIVNSGDLIGDRWKKYFITETGKAKIRIIATFREDSEGLIPTQLVVVNETGKIIPGSGYYQNGYKGERISISSNLEGVFSIYRESDNKGEYLITIGITPGDSVTTYITPSDIDDNDIAFSENSAPKISSHHLKLTTDKLINSDADEISLSVKSERGLSIPPDASFIVLIHSSESSHLTYNTNRVLLSLEYNPGPTRRVRKPGTYDNGQYFLQGRYINPDTFFPRAHCTVAMFALGKHPWMWYQQTDPEGNFFMDMSQLTGSAMVYISTFNQPLNGLSYKDEFFLEFSSKPLIFFNHQDFIALDSFVMVAKIRNVLTHQYFEQQPAKEDNASQILSELLLYDSTRIYPEPDQTYNLSDYVQFESMMELIQNIMNNVHVNKNKEGTELYIYHKQYPHLNRNPLLLINGIPTPDPEQMLNLNIRDVHRIDILYSETTLLPFGIAGLGGVIAAYTSQKVYFRNILNFNYQGLQPPPGEYRPKLAVNLPDFSPVLYWNPNVSMEKDSINIRFLTNNLLSGLNIWVVGFDGNGRIIQETGEIKIQDN